MIALLLVAFVSACQPTSTPANAIENYLQALADKDQTAAIANSCADWEMDARAEGASFINVEVGLEDLSCQTQSQSDSKATVTCDGRFVFSYDAGEDQELVLNGRLFSTIKEGGEWRMCGYQ